MVFVLELIMFMVGMRVLLRGTLPRIPFVKPPRGLKKRVVKLLGLVLVLPLPVGIGAGLLLSFLLGEASQAYDMGLDLLFFAASLAATVLILWRMWHPRSVGDSGAATEGD